MSAKAKEFVPQDTSDSPPESINLKNGHELLLNRELSWLEFNRRVLEEGLDTRLPLLERLKFLSIFSSNLDEFFMIRVSGLKEELVGEVGELSPDGMTPALQLKAISEALLPMVADQMRCLTEEVLPRLGDQKISIVPYNELNEHDRGVVDGYFIENVFPVLTPLAVDPSHPFPYISNLSLNLGLMVEPESDSPLTISQVRFARIKVPPTVERLIQVGDSELKYVFLDQVIAANTSVLFPGMRTGPAYLYRITRDADIELMEDEAGDLMRVVEQQLRKRRFGRTVRLEVCSTMPAGMIEYLTNSLGLKPEDVFVIDGPLNVPDLMGLYKLDLPELKDKPLQAVVPHGLKRDKSIFELIKKRDVLLHHPYDAYSTVTGFIESAAKDPDVLAIKMCLYRTGQDSPIIGALMEAAERGKQVAVLVELKARFDEKNNIEWARRMEKAGVHVVYGMMGLKTHCKVALVVGREGGALRRYVHLATGNYNPTTSRIYTDLGLFTIDEEIGADVSDLFNYLTGYSRQSTYRRLLVAPVNLRSRMTGLIRRETENSLAGKPARIIAKINSLTDLEIIKALYEASKAGVAIDLIVRGVCMLRPGVPGLSENIKVRSLVGRFLEHSRIFFFSNAGRAEVYIGSADWMMRNLDHRVEVVVPIKDSRLGEYIKRDILDAYLLDNVNARWLRLDGVYEPVTAAVGEQPFDCQEYFQNRHE